MSEKISEVRKIIAITEADNILARYTEILDTIEDCEDPAELANRFVALEKDWRELDATCRGTSVLKDYDIFAGRDDVKWVNHIEGFEAEARHQEPKELHILFPFVAMQHELESANVVLSKEPTTEITEAVIIALGRNICDMSALTVKLLDERKESTTEKEK